MSPSSTSKPPGPSKPTPPQLPATKALGGYWPTATAPGPSKLDCRFQTICEGCGFYQTNIEFIDILRRQRDDATSHADAARAKLYNELVRIIDAS